MNNEQQLLEKMMADGRNPGELYGLLSHLAVAAAVEKYAIRQMRQAFQDLAETLARIADRQKGKSAVIDVPHKLE